VKPKPAYIETNEGPIFLFYGIKEVISIEHLQGGYATRRMEILRIGIEAADRLGIGTATPNAKQTKPVTEKPNLIKIVNSEPDVLEQAEKLYLRSAEIFCNIKNNNKETLTIIRQERKNKTTHHGSTK